eukprot:CAMPEP_0181421740 /NCGR_PEP_ID=MMETSP1110-20121109/13252_1 /TAXON_ID=174948 /ORGANISM="Symbiodinium sp., Strain CCMP421" /LENGTH=65 /DNA_ID=CAMNT_0023544811 /DNA_START=420 /DNA_END=617 /DNA_ORIENTATION=+
MTYHLIHAAIQGASVGGAPVVAIAAITRRWAVAHMLTCKTCDRAACALRVAAVCHGCGIMAHDFL